MGTRVLLVGMTFFFLSAHASSLPPEDATRIQEQSYSQFAYQLASLGWPTDAMAAIRTLVVDRHTTPNIFYLYLLRHSSFSEAVKVAAAGSIAKTPLDQDYTAVLLSVMELIEAPETAAEVRKKLFDIIMSATAAFKRVDPPDKLALVYKHIKELTDPSLIIGYLSSISSGNSLYRSLTLAQNFLDHPDKKVRMAAVKFLGRNIGRLGDEVILDTLISQLQKEKEPSVKVEALELLTLFTHQKIEPTLVRLAAEDKSAIVRRAARRHLLYWKGWAEARQGFRFRQLPRNLLARAQTFVLVTNALCDALLRERGIELPSSHDDRLGL